MGPIATGVTLATEVNAPENWASFIPRTLHWAFRTGHDFYTADCARMMQATLAKNRIKRRYWQADPYAG